MKKRDWIDFELENGGRVLFRAVPTAELAGRVVSLIYFYGLGRKAMERAKDITRAEAEALRILRDMDDEMRGVLANKVVVSGLTMLCKDLFVKFGKKKQATKAIRTWRRMAKDEGVETGTGMDLVAFALVYVSMTANDRWGLFQAICEASDYKLVAFG